MSNLINERYRYINENITQLNGYANARLIAYISIIAGWIAISSENYTINIKIIWIISVIFIVQQISDIFSWWEYRKEQNSIDPEGTSNPNLSNFFRWKETYIILVYLIIPLIIK